MALVNEAKKAINVKIVCFGPPSAGKETSLEQLYRKLGPESRGKLKSMAVQKDRMLFFDFAPPELASLGGYSLRFHVYTVPGEVANAGVWKLVMKGADGVVFVADSAPERQDENAVWLRTLEELLPEIEQGDIPTVLFYNKRDLPGAAAVEEMQRRLNVMNSPAFPGVATGGEGVSAAFSALTAMVASRLRRTVPGLEEEPAAPAPAAALPEQEPAVAAPLPAEIEVQAPELAVGREIRLPLRVKFPGGEKRLVLTVMLDEE
jgi:uncharacterized protein